MNPQYLDILSGVTDVRGGGGDGDGSVGVVMVVVVVVMLMMMISVLPQRRVLGGQTARDVTPEVAATS